MTDSGGENRHRRSIRLKNYDYSQAGAYFVTINAYRVGAMHALPLRFGDIKNGRVNLNEFAEIVQSCWEQIPDHFKFVETDEFVVMPNHVHGIVMLANGDVGAMHALPLPSNALPLRRNFGHPPRHSLSSIIGSFKSSASRAINLSRGNPGSPVWQRNYYEHVIRNETELNQVRQYISDNPMNWGSDEDNPTRFPRQSH